ncbi:MAG: hypothetical protein AAGG68_26840 [Bacteroidota bacterium]
MKSKEQTIENTQSEDLSKNDAKKETSSNWLKILELQSWQAELLISGVIIAGLLRLPKIYLHWVEAYLLESNELGFGFISMASLFVITAINALIFFFALHFLMRSIWIALLGLNSVYPNGINVHSKQGAGPKYWKKAKEKYPDLSAYNQELDQSCSLVFSIAASTSVLCTSLSLLILLVYQLFKLITHFFPAFNDYVIPIGIALYVLFTLFGFGVQLMAKKYPNNDRVERFIDAYGEIFSNFFSLYFFKKPVGYITSIMTSNNQSKKSLFIVMGVSVVFGFISGMQTEDNPIFEHMAPKDYYAFNNQPEHFLPYNYENLKPEEATIFTPIIPSDMVRGHQLKLFIPTIEREIPSINIVTFNLLEKFQTTRTFRDSMRVKNLKQYASFNQILVNDSLYQKLDFQYYTHPNNNEEGVLTYLSTKDFKKGKNILEIRKNYFSKDDVQKIVRIPFYFEPVED